VTLTETERFPEGAAEFFDVIFAQVQEWLAVYLKKMFGLSAKVSAEAAQRLLGQVLYPRFPRALFGMDELAPSFDDDAIAADFDLKPIRRAVAELMESFEGH
jgi:hypothetical protein